jgi:hypothetical protein
MPERVDSTDPEGVDFGWVMQTTFVTTIVVGAPLVAVASTAVRLPTWTAKAGFAVRVGALVWFCTAVVVYLYARRRTAEEGRVEAGEPEADEAETADPAEDD